MPDTLDRGSLAEVMAAMAAGDQSSVLTFIDRFGNRLSSVVRRLLRDLGRADLALDRDEVSGLVIDAGFLIFQRAGGWSPEGALPWTWAERGLRSMVASHIGHATVALEADTDVVPTRSAAGSGVDPDDFEDLANRHHEVRLLHEAIVEVASGRDARVHIEYRLQKASGDPSPANTVAAMVDLSPGNVRQIDHRVRRRLVALARSDDRYSVLLGLEWLGVGVGHHGAPAGRRACPPRDTQMDRDGSSSSSVALDRAA